MYTQQPEEFIQDDLITNHSNSCDLEEKQTFADRSIGPPGRAVYINGRLYNYVEMLGFFVPRHGY